MFLEMGTPWQPRAQWAMCPRSPADLPATRGFFLRSHSRGWVAQEFRHQETPSSSGAFSLVPLAEVRLGERYYGIRLGRELINYVAAYVRSTPTNGSSIGRPPTSRLCQKPTFCGRSAALRLVLPLMQE